MEMLLKIVILRTLTCRYGETALYNKNLMSP